MSSETTQAVLNHINNVVKNKQGSLKDFTISFFGGEPLLKYNKVVVPILDHYNKVCRKNHITPYISFTSNGYLLTDKVIESLKSFNVNSFQITLDGDREHHDKTRFIKTTQRGSYDRILENVKKLLEKKINVVLRINFTEEKIPFLKTIASDIPQLSEDAKSYLTVDFQRVWQDGESDISKNINNVIDCFKNAGLQTSYFIEQLSGYQRPCYADYRNEVLINYNGDVYKCTARDFKPENRNGVLSMSGDISWKENYLEKRMNLGLIKDICKVCRIYPLCGGGCGQKMLETEGENICLMGFDDENINDIIFKRFSRRFIENQ